MIRIIKILALFLSVLSGILLTICPKGLKILQLVEVSPIVMAFTFLIAVSSLLLLIYHKNIFSFFSKVGIFNLVFLFLIFVPCTLFFANITSNSESEKRTLAEKPGLPKSPKEILLYPKNYEKYINDNFYFKQRLVSLNNFMHKKLFNRLQGGEVIVGIDGWLFYKGDDRKQVIEDLVGKTKFSSIEIDNIFSTLSSYKSYSNAIGAEFLVVIAPNKETIYTEYLPQRIIKTPLTKIDQIFKKLSDYPELKILDLRNHLLNAKNIEQIYYKTDTHWNEKGAYICYDQIMKEFGLPKKDSKIYQSSKKKYIGDLSSMAKLESEYFEEADFFNFPLHDKQSLGANDFRVINKKGRGSVVIYRDSFFSAVEPFISDSFSDSIYYWSKIVEGEKIELYSPKFIVYETVERYLPNIVPSSGPVVFSQIQITISSSESSSFGIKLFYTSKDKDFNEKMSTLKTISKKVSDDRIKFNMLSQKENFSKFRLVFSKPGTYIIKEIFITVGNEKIKLSQNKLASSVTAESENVSLNYDSGLIVTSSSPEFSLLLNVQN